MRRHALACLCLLALAGCLTEREMVLPAELAVRTEGLPVEGWQGWGGPFGSWRVGANEGEYRRSSRRVQVFWDERQRAGTGVILTGPDVTGRLAATCAARARLVDLGEVEITREPFALDCAYERDGQPLVGGLRLEAVRQPLGGPVFRDTRAGTMTLDGVSVDLLPAYELEGQGYEHVGPIGYTVLQGGRPIGAIELDTTPRVILPIGGDPRLRELVLAAGVPLAVMWDPDGG